VARLALLVMRLRCEFSDMTLVLITDMLAVSWKVQSGFGAGLAGDRRVLAGCRAAAVRSNGIRLSSFSRPVTEVMRWRMPVAHPRQRARSAAAGKT
jgi:hypothetical protein